MNFGALNGHAVNGSPWEWDTTPFEWGEREPPCRVFFRPEAVTDFERPEAVTDFVRGCD